MNAIKEINIQDYNYELPDDRIAKYPLEERASSQLLIAEGKNEFRLSSYGNIANELPKSSFLVFNNTKVVHARLAFQKESGGKVEIFCLEPMIESGDYVQAMSAKGKCRWKCLVGGLKKWKQGVLTHLHNDKIQLFAEKIELLQEAVIIEFSWKDDNLTFSEILDHFGDLPIPPYMNREAEDSDEDRYQTVYAKYEGSVAAPTAGLHFTEKIQEELNQKNHSSNYVTLHVGAGTFKPVKTATIGEHEMHAEYIDVSMSFLQNLLNAIETNQAIIPVGTTSMRTLESVYWLACKLKHQQSNNQVIEINYLKQWDAYALPVLDVSDAIKGLVAYLKQNNLTKFMAQTQLIIAPGYQHRLISGLVTNFHQPQSTLLLLVSSILGERWKGYVPTCLRQ